MNTDNMLLRLEIVELKKKIKYLMDDIPLTDLELAFRKGYLYGVANAINNSIILDEVLEWAHNNERVQPPGHPKQGQFREDYPNN